MSKFQTSQNQRGYALAEVLVATAIAAGVFAASATAISSAIRLSARTGDYATTLHEAKAITARLRSGMSEFEVLAGYDDWTITSETVDENDGAIRLRRTILRLDQGGRSEEFEVLTREQPS